MRRAANILTVLGLLAVAYWIAVDLQARFYQWREAKQIVSSRALKHSHQDFCRQDLDSNHVPERRDHARRPHPPAGSSVAILTI